MNLARFSIARSITALIAGTLGFSVFLSGAQAGTNCELKDMKGTWMFSEDGTHLDWPPSTDGSAPFSEVGWVKIQDDGTGYGETFLSVGAVPIPNPNNEDDPTYQTNFGIPIIVSESSIDPTCAGRSTFVIPGEEENPRTIRLILDKNGGEFRYISTSGDITILGNGKRID